MLKRFVALGLVCLFLVISFVVAEHSIGPYNPIADVNKDGVVDILDLVEVGQSYGSNYASLMEPNMTTVLVLSYGNNSQVVPVANAIVSADLMNRGILGGPHWKCANSTGIVTFDLSPNSSYYIMAWSPDYTEYNYANVTTNSQGEAFATIWLSYLVSPNNSPYPIQASPKGKAVVVIVDRNSSLPLSEYNSWDYGLVECFANFSCVRTAVLDWSMNFSAYGGGYLIQEPTDGIVFFHFTYPNTDYLALLYTGLPPNYRMPLCVLHTDQYGGAYAIVTIDDPW